jgi:XTP/dITP diphosphohydrolase
LAVVLYCATTNPGKVREYQSAAADLGFPDIRIELLPAVNPPEETGSTFKENASIKAAYYSTQVDGLVFADDSGLSVDALNGGPGVYSARFAGPGSTDLQNLELLLKQMEDKSDRRAHFTCAIALAQRGRVLQVFEAVADGVLLREPTGSGGFGYDPIFFYPEFNQTFAEIPAAEKLKISHRGKALKQLLQHLSLR